MYQYDLTISIVSEDEKLTEIIKNIKPKDNFTHTIETYSKVTNDLIEKTDVLIWDLPLADLLEIKDSLKSYAKVVICNNEYQKEFNNLDGILLKPFNYNYVDYIMNQILEKIKLEEDLRDINNRFNTAIDSSPDMYWEKSLNGIHYKVNKAFCEAVGKTRDDVEGKDHYYIWNVSKDDPHSGADICAQTEKMVIAKGATHSFNEPIKVHNEDRQLKTYKSPLYDRDGKVVGTIGFGHDITNYKNKSTENEFLLNSLPSAVLIKDNNGKVLNINKYFSKCFGITKEEIENTLYEEWTQKTFQPNRTTNIEGYIEGVTYPIDGEEKQFELRANEMTDIFGNKTGEICTFREVTKERKLEKENIEKSYTDQLTKLYNRQYLEEFISDQPEYMMLSLISVDLDNFKKVNDNYGHQFGDAALKLTADTLKEYFSNDSVIRMGGDEFLVVKQGDYELDNIEKEAQKFLNDLIYRFNNFKEFSNLSASIGIAQDFLALNGFDSIYMHSDDALYRAKTMGKACCCVYKNPELIKKQ